MAEVTLTDSNFDSEVIKSPIPVLVDFWAAWCQPCKMIAPSLEALATEMAGKVKIAKLNVDDFNDTASRFGVMSLPTLMVFKDGKPVKTMIGAQSKENIKKGIEEALSA